MRPPKSFKCLLAALAAGLTALAMANNGDSERQILLRLDHQSVKQAAREVLGFGRIVGTDAKSGMFIVDLDKGFDARSAISALIKRPGVKAALPMSAKSVNKRSLSSVGNYLKFWDATSDLKGGEKGKTQGEGRGGPEFYEALQYYLQRHVAVGADYVDPDALKAGTYHALTMPKARVSEPIPGAPIVGGSWSLLGPANLTIPYQIYYGTPPLSGRITCLAYDPTSASIIYAGSGGGGLWKSTNAGVSWTCLSDKAPWIYPAVNSIAIDPANHNLVLVGTGDFDGMFDAYNQGVMRSTDGGATWANVGASVAGLGNEAISHIMFDPDNANIVMCTTGRGSDSGPNNFSGNLFRSTNAGITWTSAGLIPGDYCALDVSIPNSSKVRTWYAGSAGYGTHSYLFYKSIDSGATWQAATLPGGASLEFSLACSKVSATTLYLLTGYQEQVYKSVNSAGTWASIKNNMPTSDAYDDNWSQATYDYYIATTKATEASAGEVVFVGLITCCYSTNGGTSWVNYTESYEPSSILHNDQHAIAFSPTDASQLLLGCDGGVFREAIAWSSGTPSFTLKPLNATLPISQFYAIAPHPTDATRLLGGTQDNASPSALGSFTDWANLYGGDGGYCGWNVPRGLLFTTADFGQVVLYNLSGGNENQISNGLDQNTTSFISPTMFSPDLKTIFLAGDLTIKSFDLTAASPSFVNGGLGSAGLVSAFAVAPSNGLFMYAGDSMGGVYQTTTGNDGTWSRLDGNGVYLPPALVNAVSVNPSNDKDVLVGFANTGIPHLFHTTNPSSTTNTWVNVSGTGTTGLPDVPLNAIVRDPVSPTTTWYVGTDVGVFITKNSGASWANVSDNIPHVQIFDLKMGAGYLYAGTFGRGVWRVPMPAALTSLAFNYPKVDAGSPVVATVELGSLPATAQTVTLKSTSTAAPVPASVVVNAETQSATFTISTGLVSAATAATISATDGSITKTAVLTIEPADALVSVTFPVTQETALVPVTGTLTLSAASVGTTVAKLSSSSSVAKVPLTAAIAAGAKTGTFTLTSVQVSVATPVTIDAQAGDVTKSTSITILPGNPVASLTLSSYTVIGGANPVGTVTLTRGAPKSSEYATLASNSFYAGVPINVQFEPGQITKEFTINTYSVVTTQTATISAYADGVTLSKALAIEPGAFSFVISPTAVVGGSNVNFTFGLKKSSTTTTVSFSSTSTTVEFPKTVVIPANTTSYTFAVATLGVTKVAIVTVDATIGTTLQPTKVEIKP